LFHTGTPAGLAEPFPIPQSHGPAWLCFAYPLSRARSGRVWRREFGFVSRDVAVPRSAFHKPGRLVPARRLYFRNGLVRACFGSRVSTLGLGPVRGSRACRLRYSIQLFQYDTNALIGCQVKSRQQRARRPLRHGLHGSTQISRQQPTTENCRLIVATEDTEPAEVADEQPTTST